jgi:hypothetical protein
LKERLERQTDRQRQNSQVSTPKDMRKEETYGENDRRRKRQTEEMTDRGIDRHTSRRYEASSEKIKGGG